MGVGGVRSQGETSHHRLAIAHKVVHFCISAFVLAQGDTHRGPKHYCHGANCRDFQITGNFNHKLAFLLPAPSSGREGRHSGERKNFTGIDSNLVTS